MKIPVVLEIYTKISGGQNDPPWDVYVDQKTLVFPGLMFQFCMMTSHRVLTCRSVATSGRIWASPLGSNVDIIFKSNKTNPYPQK